MSNRNEIIDRLNEHNDYCARVDTYHGYVIPQSNKNSYCRTFEFCKE